MRIAEPEIEASTASVGKAPARAAPRAGAAGRVEWSDIAKALAVMLVVWNHSATGITQLELPGPVSAFTEFVHKFNLATFYLVAGLFVCQSVRKPADAYAWSMFRLIYYPMVLWSILQGTLYALASAHVENRIGLFEPLLTSWYAPHKQMGFLLSLLVGRFLFLAADRLRIPWWGVGLGALAGIVVYAAMWAAPPPLPIRPDSVLWMSVGAGISALGGLGRIDRLSLPAALALFAGALAAAIGLYVAWPGPISSTYYSLTAMRGLGVASVTFLAISLGKMRGTGWLVYIGQRSLPIFLAHLILAGGLRIALVRVLGVENAMLVAVAAFTLGVTGPLLLYHVVGQRWLFELPRDAFGWRRPAAVAGVERN
jgi:fucose 4-O-acetylase-like acetyltransferase